MTAENYHLKWDSHLSYLNSSVATLYKNEKFADVVLYSSSSSSGSNGGDGIPTVGISAHKFILSSCSQFFATMFEAAPISAPNNILYVVLPPDLSHRAIQILVQYMYSGEATVANDILSEVLRGGEILKIRGLCRTSSTTTTTSSSSSSHNNGTNNGLRQLPPPVAHASNDMYSAAGKCSSTTSGGSNNACSTRYAIDQLQHRGLGASVMPKDSPVIVKSPKISQMALLSNNHKQHAAGIISVNKEVAIDPEDKCCYQAAEPLPTMAPTICSEVGCSSCPMAAEAEHIRRRQRSHSNEMVLPTHTRMASIDQLEREYMERPPDEHCEREDVDLHGGGGGYERRMRRRSGNEHARDYFMADHHYEHPTANITKQQYMEPSTSGLSTSPPHPHNFLAIKQEPTDWSTAGLAESNSDHRQGSVSPRMMSPKQPLDFKMPLGGAAVKLEMSSAHSADEEDPTNAANSEYDNFTQQLVCQACKKSFDDPKMWVRHLELSHGPAATIASTATTSMLEDQQAATVNTTTTNSNVIASSSGGVLSGVDTLVKTYVPKKRRRVSQQENNMNHVTLLCDLCSTSFETAAEWVRHMNNQHTEIELAMFNNKKDSEQKNNTNSSACITPSSSHHHQHQTHKKYSSRLSNNYSASSSTSEPHHASERTCDICNKRFSSHSNMMLHKRNHHHHTNNGNINSNASSLSSSPVPPTGGRGTDTQSEISTNATTSSQA